ncbi:MAG: DUF1569 domain-containing protein [Vicinamibacteria bacterium]
MLIYVTAALILVTALALLSMTLRHKTLLDPGVEHDLQERLMRLTAETRGRWGRMSAAQMLRHLGSAVRMATGDLDIPRRNTPLRLFPIKQLIVFVLPFPKSAPTAPALVSSDEADFDAERKALSELLGSFAKRDLAAWPEHPAFGALDRDQWGVMVWKHVDHHLRQFGV